jgi:hypothetical protein
MANSLVRRSGPQNAKQPDSSDTERNAHPQPPEQEEAENTIDKMNREVADQLREVFEAKKTEQKLFQRESEGTIVIAGMGEKRDDLRIRSVHEPGQVFQVIHDQEEAWPHGPTHGLPAQD